MTLIEFKVVRGLSLTALSELLGFPVSTVAGWLDGRRLPGPELLRRISAATGGAVMPAELRPDLAAIFGTHAALPLQPSSVAA